MYILHTSTQTSIDNNNNASITEQIELNLKGPIEAHCISMATVILTEVYMKC